MATIAALQYRPTSQHVQ